jgi:hypothetical protein
VSQLQECAGGDAFYSTFTDVSGMNARFNEPLTLTYLERLTFRRSLTGNPSVENQRRSSLKYLHFKMYDDPNGIFFELFAFCGNVSATLTTLKINLGKDIGLELDQLCGCSFSELEKLAFASLTRDGIQRFICALTVRAEECGDAEPHYLFILTALSLRCREGEVESWTCWRSGES